MAVRPPRASALTALGFRDFRLLLAGSLMVNFVMPLQFMSQIFWVQANYPGRQVLWVGLIGASRGLASILFSLIGGAVADRYERRHVLLMAQVASLAVNAVIAALMLSRPFGEATIVVLLVCTFSAASVMAIDAPARAASIPAIVGKEHLSSGISLNTTAMQLGIPITLPLVGFLNGRFDAGHVYAGSLVAWLLILPLAGALRFRSRGGAAATRGMLGNIVDGLRYVRGHSVIGAVLLLVVVMQVFGMPGVSTLGPVWMTTVMGLSKTEFGFMAMTWGLGGLASSFFWVKYQKFAPLGLSLCISVLVFAAGVVLFGHSRWVPATVLANTMLGFAMVATTVTAATIAQGLVADEMRGRVMGLFPLAMGLAMLAGAPVGLVAQATSLEVVVPTLGWTTLAIATLVVVSRPGLRALRPGQPVTKEALAAQPSGG